MKKLIMTIGMLVAIMSLTACGINEDNNGELDALTLLSLSQERIAQHGDRESAIMELDAIISMDMGLLEVSMPLQVYMELESLERSKTEITMSLMGMDMSLATFTRDGYQYIKSDEFGTLQQTRTPIDNVLVDDMSDLFNSIDFGEISESWIKESTATQTSNGYRLEFVYNTAGILAFIADFDMDLLDMGEFGDLLDFDTDELDTEQMEDWYVNLIIYLDQEYLPTSSTVIMFFETVVQEMGINVEMVMDMTLVIRHEDVIIDFPAWLDEIE